MTAEGRDLLVVANTLLAGDFPVERPSVVGVDRETGQLLRIAPFPWKGTDTDPPLPRWSWLHAVLSDGGLDPRQDSRTLEGAAIPTAYVEAREGWRLRWPFVRPHEVASLEEFQERARAGGPTLAFVEAFSDVDVLQLPLRFRFRCGTADCGGPHELPVLDWELHQMARLAREREGSRWASAFRERWGAGLRERFDVRLLLSTYAQAPGRCYLAGLFTPPREAEDEHAHLHHVTHRAHGAAAGES